MCNAVIYCCPEQMRLSAAIVTLLSNHKLSRLSLPIKSVLSCCAKPIKNDGRCETDVRQEINKCRCVCGKHNRHTNILYCRTLTRHILALLLPQQNLLKYWFHICFSGAALQDRLSRKLYRSPRNRVSPASRKNCSASS